MKFRTILASEFLWIILSVLVLLLLSYIPVVRNYQAVPSDRLYYGGEEYPLDMVGDLAYVQEGYHGDALTSFRYSTLLHDTPTFLKFEYLTVGWAARIMHIPPVTMFLLTRFALSLVFLTIVYWGLRLVFADPLERITGYIFVLFGASVTVSSSATSFIGKVVYDAMVFQRMSLAMHHYLLGAITILLSLFFLSRVLERPQRIKSLTVAIVFGILASLFYAPDSVLAVSGLPVYFFLDMISVFVRTKRIVVDWTKISILFVYSICVLAPVVYVRFVVADAWSQFNSAHMESLNPFNVTFFEYLLAVGAVYVLAWIAVPSVIRRGKALLLLLATWILVHPLGEFFVSPILKLNPIRYFLTPYFVVYGVLAAVGVSTLVSVVRSRMKRIATWVLTTALAAVVIATGIGTYQANWQRSNLCFCTAQFFDFAYPKRTVMDAIRWLSVNTNPNDIVLSGYYAGTLIPAFSGNRVYVSWYYRLVEPPTMPFVETQITKFYANGMTDGEAADFLKQTQVSYVFYSEGEQLNTSGALTLRYPFLRDVYNRNGTIIYRVD